MPRAEDDFTDLHHMQEMRDLDTVIPVSVDARIDNVVPLGVVMQIEHNSVNSPSRNQHRISILSPTHQSVYMAVPMSGPGTFATSAKLIDYIS